LVSRGAVDNARVEQHPSSRDPAARAAHEHDDATALDAPLGRELAELFDDPELEERLAEARDVAYAIGVAPPARSRG
jgi:hypothetical protein